MYETRIGETPRALLSYYAYIFNTYAALANVTFILGAIVKI